MSTCNRLDLQTIGSQPIMTKNLPNHCFEYPQIYLNKKGKACKTRINELINNHI